MGPNDTMGRRQNVSAHLPVALVIDDSVPLLRAVQRLLRGHFEVLAARNPAEAREAALMRHLDLILTDFDMPGEDGVEGLRSLRALGHEAPALLVTATMGAEVYAAVRDGLAAGVVEKPWEPAFLLELALELADRVPASSSGQQAG